MCRFSEQEQRDLYTHGYAAWCEKRWRDAQCLPYVDAYMERLIHRWLTEREPRGRRGRLKAA